MSIEIQNVVFACPGNSPESYDRGARPPASFYAEVLGMRITREDWFVIEHADDPDGLNLAFGDGPIDYCPPRWPDPTYPQHLHLDISVPDLDDAEKSALALGAAKLQSNDSFSVYADPIGHPFCFYQDAACTPTAKSGIGRIERVVIDCFSPRSLADFYARLLSMPQRQLDTPERVVIARETGPADTGVPAGPVSRPAMAGPRPPTTGPPRPPRPRPG